MTPLLSHLSALAAAALIATAWQALLLTALAALYLCLLPRRSPEVRYTVWAALLPVITLLPVLSILTGALSASRLPSPGTIPGLTPVLHPLLSLDLRWSVAIASLWAALSLVRAVRLGIGALRLRTIARSAKPVDANHAITTLLTTTHQRFTTLCTTDSAEITQPSVVGFRHPRILIPSAMYARLTPSDLHQIVLHELEHLRRHDDWMNLVQKLSLVLFPLNPTLWWVERSLCRERELACDNGVLRRTAAPKLYASCLVHLAEERLRFRQLPLALGAWARQSELSQRIHHILQTRNNKQLSPHTATFTTILVLALCSSSALLSRVPQLVAFSSPATVSSSSPNLADIPPLAEIHAPQLAPASYTADRQHATLLRAVMPSSAPSHAVWISARRKTLKTLRRVRHPQRGQRLVITAQWDQLPSVPRLVLAADEPIDFSHTYAAVPTPGGWIVFQL